MSKENDRLLGHADEADGIEEYDNPLPDWWLGLFWGSIVWAIGYVAWFALTDQSQVSWYQAEVAAADERFPEQAQANVQFAYSEDAASAGAEVWASNCFQCHGDQLQGGIGPSLVDDEWIHGGQARQILAVIQNGVLDKGMPAWSGILSPEQVNQVTSYVVAENAQATGRRVEDILAPAEEGMATPDGSGEAPAVSGEAPAADTAVDEEAGPGA